MGAILLVVIIFFVISFIWFQSGIGGDLKHRYDLTFEGILLYIICLGIGSSKHGRYFLIGNIPLFGFGPFFKTLNDYKSLLLAWFISIISGLILIIFAILRDQHIIHIVRF